MGRGRRDGATNRSMDRDRDALIEQLRSEIQQARGEVAWLRSLVEELTRRVPELPAGSPQPAPATPSTMPDSGPERPVSLRQASDPFPCTGAGFHGGERRTGYVLW
jgi:hypothetical protein